MKILVLGGCGLIGSHVVDMLVAGNARVVVLDREQERFRSAVPGVMYLRGDLADIGTVDAILSSGIDAVIHLAWAGLPATSIDNPAEDIRFNVIASVNLFASCIKRAVAKVIFASSGGTVYGVTGDVPVTEDQVAMPICSYGITKLAVENYLQMHGLLYGLKGVSLRISNVYGIRQDPSRPQGAIASFVSKAIRGETIDLWGGGSAIRDFVHVHDVSEMFRNVLLSDKTGVFNVGSGTGLSMNGLIDLIRKECGLPVTIIRKASRKFDVPKNVLDISLATQTFNWRPRISITEGLKEVREWLTTRELESTA